MQYINVKLVICGILAISSLSTFGMAAAADQRPDLPPGCEHIAAPADAQLAFNLYAIGVQIYQWNGTSWDFVAPDASLFADVRYRGQVGTHYAGPKWESNSGGWVQASRVDGCDVDPANNIPWLLLNKVAAEGPGAFSNVTSIQRLNTTGGVKPTVPGTFVGDVKRVPYTAEYYFYR